MFKISLLILALLAMPAMARVTGDPIDGNEVPPYDLTNACEISEQWPSCVPCWTTCIYSIIAEIWVNSEWDWDDF